ncbi:hypothetical protein [Phenylobacterium sp.]|uniref:hypothetical protein n=1 Tax=Phenylobacterium sp. TaxID=1871053 RepID=UPI002BCED2D2|nr:hypothetical protein [Phenylobacterium sp.]HVI33969.1 hypothetical protein [Phenylobacterium sp.]
MEIGDLPPRQRATRYKDLAQAQRELADACDLPEIRATHLELAAMWARLAEEAERHADTPRPGDADESAAPAA